MFGRHVPGIIIIIIAFLVTVSAESEHVNDTAIFSTVLTVPLLTTQWLAEQTKLRGQWRSKCESYNSQPELFSVQSELTICGSVLTLVKSIYTKNPRTPNVNTCANTHRCVHLCGPSGELVMNVSITSDIILQTHVTSREWKLDLDVSSFILQTFSDNQNLLPTNCTSGAVSLNDHTGLAITHAQCGNWWRGGVVYTTIRTSGATGSHPSVVFGDIYYTDPDHQYAAGGGVPGSTPALRLQLSKHNRLGNDFAPLTDTEFRCHEHDHKYDLPKSLIFVDIGSPYLPEYASDFGSCASFNANTLPTDKPLLQLIETSLVADNPAQVLSTLTVGTHANFLQLPNSYLYSPLHGIVPWVTRTVPDNDNISHRAEINATVFASLKQLVACTRPSEGNSSLVTISNDDALATETSYSFWISTNFVNLGGTADVPKLTLRSERRYFSVDVEGNGDVVSISDAKFNQSWATLKNADVLYDSSDGCPNNWGRMYIHWRLSHNRTNDDNRVTGVFRVDQIKRHLNNGGCYGFPSATSPLLDPMPFGYALGLGHYTPPDLNRCQPQADELQLLYDPTIAHVLSDNDPRTWNPEDPSICQALTGAREKLLCQACTICNFSPASACEHNRTQACITHCLQHELPDICYTHKPDKTRTVTVEYPQCEGQICTQDITILSDCLQLPSDSASVNYDYFYTSCPNRGTIGLYEFDYHALTCTPTTGKCHPFSDVTVQSYPEEDIDNNRHIHTPRTSSLDLEFFVQPTNYWGQHLTNPSFSAIEGRSANFPTNSYVVIGERFIAEQLLNIEPLRITDITICSVQLSNAIRLYNWLMIDASRTCARGASSFGVLSAHRFLINGADSDDCFGTAPDGSALSGVCVDSHHLPKVATTLTDFTARSGVRLFMCRKDEPPSDPNIYLDSNPPDEFDSNQYVGCDAVGIATNTIVGVLGLITPTQVYFLEQIVQTQAPSDGSTPPTRRRLLGVSGPTTSSPQPVSFTISESLQTGSTAEDRGDSSSTGIVVETKRYDRHRESGDFWWIGLLIFLVLLGILLVVVAWNEKKRRRHRYHASPADSPISRTSSGPRYTNSMIPPNVSDSHFLNIEGERIGLPSPHHRVSAALLSHSTSSFASAVKKNNAGTGNLVFPGRLPDDF